MFRFSMTRMRVVSLDGPRRCLDDGRCGFCHGTSARVEFRAFPWPTGPRCHNFLFEIFVLLAADQSAARSIIVFKQDEDKIYELDRHKAAAAVGEAADRTSFMEFIQRNMALDEFRTGLTKSSNATAHYIRGELASRLRKAPVMVNMLIGGVDMERATGSAADSADIPGKPQLFFLDYLGTLQKVHFGCHGHTSNFLLSVFDRYWEPDMDVEQALDVMSRCVAEINLRFLVHQPKFVCKKISKEGIEVVDIPERVLPDIRGSVEESGPVMERSEPPRT